MDKTVLANGYQIPNICYGTDIISYDFFGRYKTKDYLKRIIKTVKYGYADKYKKNKGIINCVQHAVENGCAFFDTARAYSASERMLGSILNSLNRNDYYICTKLCNDHQLHDKPARECVQESMKELNVNYIDLYLLHWPVDGKYLDYWKQLERLYAEGIVKAIGVSNCKVHHLEEIKKIASILPMVNEVELHPLLTEKALLDYCKINNIQIMAYSSTARSDFRLKNSRRLEDISKKYNKSLSQVILRWHIQNGVIPIFNTSSITHFKENMNIFDFELDSNDIEIIDNMNINSRTRYDSDNCEWDRL